MNSEQNIPHAPAELRRLLERLHAETDLLISQHLSEPRPGEWYAGWRAGDVGPYASAEDALVAGVAFLCRLIRQQDADDEDGLGPWRKAFGE